MTPQSAEPFEVLNRRISLRQAAKHVRKNERFVRELIEAGQLRAWREGGEQRPRFLVLPDEVEAAVLNATQYFPSQASPPRHLARRSPARIVKPAKVTPGAIPIHPDVKC